MGTPEPSSLRSVPGAAPGRELQIHGCDGVDWPENGVKCGGHPNPRLSIEPVRTTSSASRPRSVRSYCFSQPGASPGGGVGIVGSGDGVTGVALPDGDALSPGDAASAGASDDWFDLTQPASANTKISAIKEATTRSVRIGPPARSRFADDFRRTAGHLSVIPLRTCRALRGTTELGAANEVAERDAILRPL